MSAGQWHFPRCGCGGTNLKVSRQFQGGAASSTVTVDVIASPRENPSPAQLLQHSTARTTALYHQVISNYLVQLARLICI